MSRSGYSDECEYVELYRQSVANAIRGKRGQVLLRDLRLALDEMPSKELISGEIVNDAGLVCALGAVGMKRGINGLARLDPYDHVELSETFNVAPCLAAEVEDINDTASGWEVDEYGRWMPCADTPSRRWERVSKWVNEHIKTIKENGSDDVATTTE